MPAATLHVHADTRLDQTTLKVEPTCCQEADETVDTDDAAKDDHDRHHEQAQGVAQDAVDDGQAPVLQPGSSCIRPCSSSTMQQTCTYAHNSGMRRVHSKDARVTALQS